MDVISPENHLRPQEDREGDIWSLVLLDGFVLLLPILSPAVVIEDNMSVSNLEKVTDADLKKRLNKLIDLDDWTDKCAACGKPDLLHKRPCTRTENNSPEELIKIWTEFKTWMKTILR